MSEKKIALVTGGTRGIGAAISKYLEKHGFHVVANYHSNEEAAQAFKKETGADIVKFDVADFNQVQTAVDGIIKQHGAIHVLVNNAGITKDGVFHKMSEEAWDAVIDTNLKSAFSVTRAVIGSMRDQGF